MSLTGFCCTPQTPLRLPRRHACVMSSALRALLPHLLHHPAWQETCVFPDIVHVSCLVKPSPPHLWVIVMTQDPPPDYREAYRECEACSTFSSGISPRAGQAGAWLGEWYGSPLHR